jgi:hypothetical protein
MAGGLSLPSYVFARCTSDRLGVTLQRDHRRDANGAIIGCLRDVETIQESGVAAPPVVESVDRWRTLHRLADRKIAGLKARATRL